MELLTVIVFRSLERIAAIITGCFLIHLGYRLFLEIPAKENSEGKFTLPGGAAIHLLRVGPGVFFSLFGTAILIFSFLNPVDYKENITTDTAGKIETSVSYLGAGAKDNVDFDQGEIIIERSSLQMDIIVLNTITDHLRSDLPEEVRFDIEQAIPRIKLSAMKSVWNKKWGEFHDFKKWFDLGGDVNNPPEKFRPALDYFSRR